MNMIVNGVHATQTCAFACSRRNRNALCKRNARARTFIIIHFCQQCNDVSTPLCRICANVRCVWVCVCVLCEIAYSRRSTQHQEPDINIATRRRLVAFERKQFALSPRNVV